MVYKALVLACLRGHQVGYGEESARTMDVDGTIIQQRNTPQPAHRPPEHRRQTARYNTPGIQSASIYRYSYYVDLSFLLVYVP